MRKSPFNRLELAGQTYGRLTVVSEAQKRFNQRHWLCACACGKETVVSQPNLRSGVSTSCGCLHKEIISAQFATHRKTKTPEYQVWKGMHQRCNNPKNKSFVRYGGRGIKICDAWLHSFDTFIGDMGPRPSDQHSIDRIDNNGDYAPDNCRWVLEDVQQLNKRSNHFIEFKGERLSLSQWAEKLNLSPSLLHARLNKLHWPLERALSPK